MLQLEWQNFVSPLSAEVLRVKMYVPHMTVHMPGRVASQGSRRASRLGERAL